jgi:predicted MFS family arabinose efflux permease
MAPCIGPVLNNVAAGYLGRLWGYNAGFLSPAGVAMIAFTACYSKMPEVQDIQKTRTAVEGS